MDADYSSRTLICHAPGPSPFEIPSTRSVINLLPQHLYLGGYVRNALPIYCVLLGAESVY